MAMAAPAPKMPPKQKTTSAAGNRRTSRQRLEKNALEAALDDVYKEEEEEQKPGTTSQEKKAEVSVDTTVIHGHERTGGVDPSFAAALHDKLVDQGIESEAEPSGLRAPCTTCKLSPQELALLAADDEDDSQAIHVHTTGALDSVDSKLVTELQRKLQGEEESKPSQKDDFAAALNKGLASAVQSGAAEPQSHGAIDSINDALVMNLQKKLGGISGEEADESMDVEVETKSGLRAPQCTVKLSAADLASMDDEDEVTVDTKSHGAIDNVNSSLVTQLQQKLADQSEDIEEGCKPSGFRAPANTQKISAEMMNALDDEDEDEAAAPMPGMAAGVDPSLVIELKRKLEDGEAEAEKDPSKVVKATGDPTVQLSADMLAALELADEEEEEKEQQKMEDLKNQLCSSNKQVVTSGQAELDAGFASSLAQGLEQMGVGAAPSATADLSQEDKDDKEMSGLKAPQCTEVITADMLAALDDNDPEDDAAPAEAEGQIADAVSRLLGQEQTQESWQAVSGAETGSKKEKKKKQVNVGFRSSDAGNPQPTSIMDQLSAKLAGEEADVSPTPTMDAGDSLPRAPANTMMLSDSQMAALDDDEDIPMMDAPQMPADVEDVPSGAKAPHSTCMLSGDQLNALVDDDEEEVTEVPREGMKAPHSTVALSADLLDVLDDDDPMGTDTGRGPMFDVGDDDDEAGPVGSGMKAPHTTTVLTQDQLDAFNDDEDEEVIASGTKAPHTTCMLRADDLAQLDDDVEEDAQGTGPAEDIATQVVQRVRDMPEAMTDPWGNLPSNVPVTSSCKLRLGWLSKDEIRKENDQLRKEIVQLRKEIEAHRKASLSQKA